MTLTVSDPQPSWTPELTVRGYVHLLRSKGKDVHEFSTAYVNRTIQLGYPPNLDMSVKEFLKS